MTLAVGGTLNPNQPTKNLIFVDNQPMCGFKQGPLGEGVGLEDFRVRGLVSTFAM